MKQKLTFIFVFLVFLFSLSAQEIIITDFTVVAGSYGHWHWQGELREKYDELVDKDIQELMNREGVQYVDALFRLGVLAWVETQDFFSVEDIISIQDIFTANILNMENHRIYRSRFKKGYIPFVVYTTLVPPWSFAAFFRIFVRASQ